MISDLEIDRIATTVVRKMAESELDRLIEDLHFEQRLAEYEAQRIRVAREGDKRRRRRGRLRVAAVLVLALVYVFMFEAL